MGSVGDRLWDSIRAVADIAVLRPEDVFHDVRVAHTIHGDGLERTVGVTAVEAEDGTRLWECVLHGTTDTEAALALFLDRVVASHGETDISTRLEAGGLVYLAARLDEVGARELSALNPLRAVRPLPQIRPLVPLGFRAVDVPTLAPPTDASPLTEHRIAVFDGGLDEACPISSQATRVVHLTTAPPESDGVRHGSVVTNAALFGYVASGDSLRRPEVGIDHYRIWPPPRDHTNDPDLYWILRQIKDVITKEQYRVAVICVAPDQEVDDATPHPWTAVLDDVAHETGALFVVAAGNRGDLAPETGLHRVQVPADMANALGVGAATSRQSESKKWDRAYYSSYGPGRPGAIMQPLVLQFGGTPDAPFLGITARGERVSTMGTSFAAPLVAHGLAGALAAVGSAQATAAFLCALAVHASERNRPHRPVTHSFGRTLERFDAMWNCRPNEVTLLYADKLERHTPIALPLPVPDGLPEDTVVRIRCTAAFQTRVDATNPVDYSLSAITWTFRPHMQLYTFRLGEGDEREEQIVDTRDEALVEALLTSGWMPGAFPNGGPLNEFRSEEERRRTDGKWETVFQAWAQPSVANLHAPQLEFRYLAREDGTLLRGDQIPPLPFALFVTVTAPTEIPLYDLVRQQFQLLTPIQLDARVQVRIQSLVSRRTRRFVVGGSGTRPVVGAMPVPDRFGGKTRTPNAPQKLSQSALSTFSVAGPVALTTEGCCGDACRGNRD